MKIMIKNIILFCIICLVFGLLGCNGEKYYNEQVEKNVNRYSFDESRASKKGPDYQIEFNCTFPKAFSCNSGEVIIEKVTYEVIDENYIPYFELSFTGTDGYHNTYYQSKSTKKSVGWKLYDPDGYVIDSGTFYTESLFYGDKFKDKKLSNVGRRNLKSKGVYKLELMNKQ